jgi:hypothetical protein
MPPLTSAKVQEILHFMTKQKGSISVDRSFPAQELRELLKPIFNKLKKAGVREDRYPSAELILSHLLEWVDDEKVSEWVQKYADVEA